MNNQDMIKTKYALHVRYIIIIALIICIGSIVLSGYNDSAFVLQFSFASTITSIVLSVVAIWMSISGERNTNEIKNNISSTVDRLANTTGKIENVNDSINNNMHEQLESLIDLKNDLKSISNNLLLLKDEMSSYKCSVEGILSNNKASGIGAIEFNDDQIFYLYQNIRSKESATKVMIDRVIEEVISSQIDERDLVFGDFKKIINDTNAPQEFLFFCIAVAGFFSSFNFNNRDELYKKIVETSSETKGAIYKS